MTLPPDMTLLPDMTETPDLTETRARPRGFRAPTAPQNRIADTAVTTSGVKAIQ
jgi:hypothetical protein